MTKTRPAAEQHADSYRLAEQVKQLVNHRNGNVAAAAAAPASTSSDSYSPALTLIRSAPPSAATVVVWNVLLNAVLTPSPSQRGRGGQHQHAAAVRRAYEIWMEMKRRGVVPTSRSYGTFLTGVAKRAKRAAFDAEAAGAGAAARASLQGWNADLRAKVETVHKQWRTHCERVHDRAAAAKPSSTSSTAAEVTDGRHDSVESLSPLPTNQYLSFLSAALTIALTAAATPAPAITTSPDAGVQILDHLVRTFEAMPDPDENSRLGRTTVSYQVVYAAFKAVLSSPSASHISPSSPPLLPPPLPSSSPLLDVEGLELRTLGPAVEVGFPTAQQVLDRALAMWDHLILHPPAPEFVPTSRASGLTPIVPTALLSLYLSLPPATSSTLPPATHARFLAVPQRAFGFVEPARAADLELPHPADLAVPLCAGAGLDSAAFGAALRTASRAPVGAGRGDDPLRWTRAWWDQLRDYPARFGFASGQEDEAVGLLGREAASEVIKAAGRAGDVEAIEGGSSPSPFSLYRSLADVELCLRASQTSSRT